MSILNLFPLGLQNIQRQTLAPYLAFSHIAHFFGCAKLPQNKQNCIIAIYVEIDNLMNSVKLLSRSLFSHLIPLRGFGLRQRVLDQMNFPTKSEKRTSSAKRLPRRFSHKNVL